MARGLGLDFAAAWADLNAGDEPGPAHPGASEHGRDTKPPVITREIRLELHKAELMLAREVDSTDDREWVFNWAHADAGPARPVPRPYRATFTRQIRDLAVDGTALGFIAAALGPKNGPDSPLEIVVTVANDDLCTEIVEIQRKVGWSATTKKTKYEMKTVLWGEYASPDKEQRAANQPYDALNLGYITLESRCEIGLTFLRKLNTRFRSGIWLDPSQTFLVGWAYMEHTVETRQMSNGMRLKITTGSALEEGEAARADSDGECFEPVTEHRPEELEEPASPRAGPSCRAYPATVSTLFKLYDRSELVARCLLTYNDASDDPCAAPTIDKLEVRRSRRGKGLAKLLYNAVETWSRDHWFFEVSISSLPEDRTPIKATYLTSEEVDTIYEKDLVTGDIVARSITDRAFFFKYCGFSARKLEGGFASLLGNRPRDEEAMKFLPLPTLAEVAARDGYANNCAKCLAPALTLTTALLRCSRCQAVRYCGQGCQRADWANHKLVCGKSGAKKEEVPPVTDDDYAPDTTGLMDRKSTGRRMCSHCEACEQEGEKMKKCEPCGMVYYCSVECQRANWRLHKLWCGKSREQLLHLLVAWGLAWTESDGTLVRAGMPMS